MTSGDQHVLHALGNLMAESRSFVLAEGEPGLRASHHRVIGHVPPEGITVTDLAERVGMTKQGIGQFVTQLTESGHLTVATGPDDRRVRVVRRTAEGDAAARRLSDLLGDLEAEWANRVGTRRYDEFRATLDELAALPARDSSELANP
jgi:DNA-binding MarR family transcriptional regulator